MGLTVYRTTFRDTGDHDVVVLRVPAKPGGHERAPHDDLPSGAACVIKSVFREHATHTAATQGLGHFSVRKKDIIVVPAIRQVCNLVADDDLITLQLGPIGHYQGLVSH